MKEKRDNEKVGTLNESRMALGLKNQWDKRTRKRGIRKWDTQN